MKVFVLGVLLCLASAQKQEAKDDDAWVATHGRTGEEDHVQTTDSAEEREEEEMMDRYDWLGEDVIEDDENDDEEDYHHHNHHDDHMHDEYPDYTNEYDDEGEDRIKRKVIFGGGGGYTGIQRRGGGGGDPYGRRRDNHNYHGPDYGNYESWPYRRGDYVDTSSYDSPTTTTTTPTTSRPAQTRSRAYGIVRSSPDDDSRIPSVSGRKSKTGRRETKRKLPKDVKFEIAEYALEHGITQAVHHYSQQMGKRISEKKIEKFIKRYKQKQQSRAERHN